MFLFFDFCVLDVEAHVKVAWCIDFFFRINSLMMRNKVFRMSKPFVSHH